MSQLALDQQQGDRRTRQAIIYSLCGIAWVFCMTICFLALKQLPIPDPLDRLATFVVGNISGMLIKTAADKALGTEATPLTVETAPDKPLETVDASSDADAPDNSSITSPKPSPLSKTVLKTGDSI